MVDWAAALAGADHGKLHLGIQVEGIPYSFVDTKGTVPTGFLFGTKLPLITSLEQSETRLNLARRRVEGGSLTVRLQDDDDGTLAALFAPRQYRKSFVTAAVSAAGDITVAGVGGLPAAPGPVYIDGETVSYASIVGTTLTGCTRGAFGSVAQGHVGEATDGADVYTAPPSWQGRRVTLVAWFEPNSAGSLVQIETESLQDRFARFMLAKAPKYLGNDEWELSCVDLIEEFGTKKIGAGFTDVQLDSPVSTRNAGGNVELVVGTGFNFHQFVAGTQQTILHMKSEDGHAGFTHFIGNNGTDTIEYEYSASSGATHGGRAITEVRHLAVLSQPVGFIALFILASRLGDGANGVYDQLPGYDATDIGEDSNRMGAGILEADIDVDAFLSFNATKPWSYPIDDEVEVGDFLFDWCLATETFWFVGSGGKITVRSLAEDGTAAVMTVDDSIADDFRAIEMSYEEEGIYPHIRIECNYEPTTHKYLLVENSFDVPMQKRYPRREAALELKSKGLAVDAGASSDAEADNTFATGFPRPAIAEATLRSMLRRLQVAEGRGRVYVTFACQLPILKASLGDIVTLNNLDVPDGAGGVTLSDQPARIVAMRPRWGDAVVDVTFQLLEKLWRVAPAAQIASVAGAVLTLKTTGAELPDAFPGRMFADAQHIEVWDVSAGSATARTVASHTDTTVTLSSAVAGLVAGDFIRLAAQNVVNENVSADGYVGSDFLYQMPDDENDGTPVEITRWR